MHPGQWGLKVDDENHAVVRVIGDSGNHAHSPVRPVKDFIASPWSKALIAEVRATFQEAAQVIPTEGQLIAIRTAAKQAQARLHPVPKPAVKLAAPAKPKGK